MAFFYYFRFWNFDICRMDPFVSFEISFRYFVLKFHHKGLKERHEGSTKDFIT